MRFEIILILVLFGLATTITPAKAVETGYTQNCKSFVVVATIGVINAGTYTACLSFPTTMPETDSAFFLGASITGPNAVVGVVTTFVWQFAGNGCTVGAPIINTNAGVITTESSAYSQVTMTSPVCSGTVQAVVAIAAVTIVNWNDVFFTIVPEQHICSYVQTTCNLAQQGLCSGNDARTSNTCNNLEVDILARICDASSTTALATWKADCHTLDVWNHLCGVSIVTDDSTKCTPAFYNQTGSSIVFPADINFHQCSSRQGVCTPAYYNGTTVISSWPTLTANVANTGTINVVNSGTQSFSITSWPTLLSKIIAGNQTICLVTSTGGCGTSVNLNEINSGTLAVTNSGGQTISVSSWPQLTAILSNCIVGTYGATSGSCNTQACGATIICKETGNSTVTIAGNATSTTNVASFDWNAFVIKYIPLALAFWTFALYWRRGLFIFGIMAIALLLYSMIAYPFSLVVKVVFLATIMGLLVSLIFKRKGVAT